MTTWSFETNCICFENPQWHREAVFSDQKRSLCCSLSQCVFRILHYWFGLWIINGPQAIGSYFLSILLYTCLALNNFAWEWWGTFKLFFTVQGRLLALANSLSWKPLESIKSDDDTIEEEAEAFMVVTLFDGEKNNERIFYAQQNYSECIQVLYLRYVVNGWPGSGNTSPSHSHSGRAEVKSFSCASISAFDGW